VTTLPKGIKAEVEERPKQARENDPTTTLALGGGTREASMVLQIGRHGHIVPFVSTRWSMVLVPSYPQGLKGTTTICLHLAADID
jgi:hypothetical protein